VAYNAPVSKADLPAKCTRRVPKAFLVGGEMLVIADVSSERFGTRSGQCSRVNEYCGISAAQPMRRCGLTIASSPLDSKART
jgi:hypothetical protein